MTCVPMHTPPYSYVEIYKSKLFSLTIVDYFGADREVHGMGQKPRESEIVADDGLHRVERISVSDATYKASHPESEQDDSAEQERLKDFLDEIGRAATFEGAIGEVEAYWRAVTPDATAKPLSKTWYRARILREVESLRKALDSPDTGRLHPNLEYWVVSAINLGVRAEEAEWRFGFGGLARRWLNNREKNVKSAQIGVRTKADTKERQDRLLLAAINGQRQRRPNHSVRTVAQNLVDDFGNSDNRHPVEALAKRIGRLLRHRPRN